MLRHEFQKCKVIFNHLKLRLMGLGIPIIDFVIALKQLN